jgi:hypothetical protein
MTDEFAEFLSIEELNNASKGKIIGFTENLSKEEIESLTNQFLHELKTISMMFKEFTNEFFKHPIASVHTEMQWTNRIQEDVHQLHSTLKNNVEKLYSSEIYTSIKEIDNCLKEINKDMDRYLKYISITVNIEEVAVPEEGTAAFDELFDIEIAIMENMAEIIDEHNFGVFSKVELLEFKKSAIMHIKNARDLVNLASLDDMSETKIRHIMGVTARLAMLVSQINMITQ